MSHTAECENGMPHWHIASWLSLAKCKIEKLNPQCSKLALFANTITEICGRILYYIVDLADQLHFYFAFCR